MNLARIRKFLASALATAAIAAQAAVTDGVITRQEWVQIAVAAVGTTLVYYLRNQQPKMVSPTLFAGRSVRGGYESGDTPASELRPPDRPRE